ncbi:hypothetical protein [Rhizobium tropici]|uniref:thiolase family protein n=1 Tax=Rhizobium tropici TaxID=398 RepID=UPI001FDEC7DA|nr:hypothetical protein [Rhizobium tropici]
MRTSLPVISATAIVSAVDRAGVISADVHELLLGQVLAAGEGRNPVRRAAKDVRMPDEANGEPDATIVTHSLAETEQALSGHAWRDDREYSAYAECVSAIKHHLRNCAKSFYMQAQRVDLNHCLKPARASVR